MASHMNDVLNPSSISVLIGFPWKSMPSCQCLFSFHLHMLLPFSNLAHSLKSIYCIGIGAEKKKKWEIKWSLKSGWLIIQQFVKLVVTIEIIKYIYWTISLFLLLTFTFWQHCNLWSLLSIKQNCLVSILFWDFFYFFQHSLEFAYTIMHQRNEIINVVIRGFNLRFAVSHSC